MKILIVNAWGGNRGDEAMLNSLFHLIKGINTNAMIDVLPFRNERLDIDKGMRVLNDRIGLCYYSWSSHIYRIAGRNRIVQRILEPLCMVEFAWKKGIPLLKLYDLIINAPQGPTIGDMYPFKERTIYPLYMAKEYGIPYLIIGVSMGPFDREDKSRELTHKVLQGASAIILRENISLSYVQKAYPDLTKLHSAIDIVFSTPISLARKPQGLLIKYDKYVAGVRPGCIGACISLTRPRGRHMPFNKGTYLKKMALFFDHVINTTGKDLFLFPHLDFDMPALQQISRLSRHPGKISVFPPYFDSDFQQHFMARLEFFISSRYHPAIFAIKAGVPFMCIKNQFKVEGMLDKLELKSEVCWQDESLESFLATFDRAWTNKDTLRLDLPRAFMVAKQQSAIYSRVIKDYIYGED